MDSTLHALRNIILLFRETACSLVYGKNRFVFGLWTFIGNIEIRFLHEMWNAFNFNGPEIHQMTDRNSDFRVLSRTNDPYSSMNHMDTNERNSADALRWNDLHCMLLILHETTVSTVHCTHCSVFISISHLKTPFNHLNFLSSFCRTRAICKVFMAIGSTMEADLHNDHIHCQW